MRKKLLITAVVAALPLVLAIGPVTADEEAPVGLCLDVYVEVDLGDVPAPPAEVPAPELPAPPAELPPLPVEPPTAGDPVVVDEHHCLPPEAEAPGEPELPDLPVDPGTLPVPALP